MERKGRISCNVLTCILLLTYSCSEPCGYADVEIILADAALSTKAMLPEENRISDATFIVFDSRGKLEYSIYTSAGGTCSLSLLKGERYSIYSFVNFGYKVRAVSLADLKGTEYHIAYPDEYRNGIPMTASANVVINDDSRLEIHAERLMAKISLRMDRSRLSDGVSMNVTSARICNCPKHTRIFEENRIESHDECFSTGFTHKGSECAPLNTEDANRISDCISMYMFENIQGEFSDSPIESDGQKVFAEYDKRKDICSYVEIEMEYSSPLWSTAGGPLTYRFYLGDGRDNLDIERNCHYHITITPEDDGLKGDGWRVDKSGLKYNGVTGIEKYPSDYIRGEIGDRIHLGCILTPANTPFDIGLSYLEDDKAEGIYDYEIDSDGHGVTLSLTGPGRGLIYMEAGDPINEAALFIVEVNQPE